MQNSRLSAIQNAALKFLVPSTPEETYSNIVKEAVIITNAAYGSISLYEQNKFHKVYSTSPLVLKSGNRPKANTYKAYKEKKIIITPISELARAHPNLVKIGIKWNAFIPLSYQNKAIGVLTLNFTNAKKPNSRDFEVFNVYGSMASLAIKKTQLYAETKRALEMRNTFISLIAHELRTPLTAISGYIQLLHKKQKDTEGQEAKWIQETYAEVMRLGNLINEVVEANRIETKKQQFYWDTLYVSKILGKSINSLKKVYPQHEFVFTNNIQNTEDRIIGDKEKLAQALISLLDNAAKFSDPGKKISVTELCVKKNIEIVIKDEGRGIEESEIDHVFKEFYKGENNHTVGMGLGLLIAKNIIAHHRGTIDLSSIVGKGTTATVTLPKANL